MTVDDHPRTPAPGLLAAISKARHDFAAAADITFIDLSADDAFEQLCETVVKYQTRGWPADAAIRRIAERHAMNIVNNDDGLANREEKTLCVRTKQLKNRLIKSNTSEAVEVAWTFYHELAHLLIPRHIVPVDFHVPADKRWIETNIAEAQADVFACMTGIAQGWMDWADVQSLRQGRYERYAKDPAASYQTHTALDALIAGGDTFTALPPQERLQAATTLGLFYAAGAGEILKQPEAVGIYTRVRKLFGF